MTIAQNIAQNTATTGAGFAKAHTGHIKATAPKTVKHEATTVNRGFTDKNATALAYAVVKKCFELNGIDSKNVEITTTFEGNTDNTVRYLKVTYSGITFEVTTSNQAFSAYKTYTRLKDKAERAKQREREERKRKCDALKGALDTLLKTGLLTPEEYREKCDAVAL